uniref:Uncharacterized protein n=1 Tax=Magallana gigas TaxID=29159 RepID=A0A8W8MP80_MAGGI
MLDQCKHNKIHSISAAVVCSKDEMSIEVTEELKWLFEEIKEKGIEARKTLIYVRSFGRGGCLFRDILGHLRNQPTFIKLKDTITA